MGTPVMIGGCLGGVNNIIGSMYAVSVTKRPASVIKATVAG